MSGSNAPSWDTRLKDHAPATGRIKKLAAAALAERVWQRRRRRQGAHQLVQKVKNRGLVQKVKTGGGLLRARLIRIRKACLPPTGPQTLPHIPSITGSWGMQCESTPWAHGGPLQQGPNQAILKNGQKQPEIGHQCTPHPATHVPVQCPGPTHSNITQPSGIDVVGVNRG